MATPDAITVDAAVDAAVGAAGAIDASGAIDAGEAWFELPARHWRGRVLASFRRTFYVELDGAVLAVVPAGAPAGPLHLRIGAVMPPAPGTYVRVTGRPPAAALWRPPALDAALVRSRAGEACRLLASSARSDLADHPSLATAEQALARDDLAAAVDALAGLGAGLTPAGDDVLAGVFVVLAAAGQDERVLREAVSRARTHAISRAFLAWAARGRAVEPVHLLLGALIGSGPAALADPLRAVLALGHSSGADVVLGLRLGLGALVSP